MKNAWCPRRSFTEFGVFFLLLLLSISVRALAVLNLDLVTIGDPGNPRDDGPATGLSHTQEYLGRVDTIYRIARTEFTDAQYVDFLNAVEPTGNDTALQLYNPQMSSDVDGGILFSAGAPDGQHYSLKPGRGQRPVSFINYLDAMRLCNWLHNGQPTGGGTEAGAYTLNGDLTSGLQPTNIGARFWIPTEKEWYKAAFYDPTRPTLAGSPRFDAARGSGPYWWFGTRSDFRPTDSTPSSSLPNAANWHGASGSMTDVGSYPQSASYYGTLDQNGNVFEMTTAIVNGNQRILRGDYWASDFGIFMESGHSSFVSATTELPNIGFRVAAAPADAPEPPANPIAGSSRLRIVAIGDDITQGDGNRKSYRYPLWQKLLDAGANFDFVGSLNYNQYSNPVFPPYRGQLFDPDHEGHASTRASDIRFWMSYWLNTNDGTNRPYTPDVALIHIGTNDCILSVPTADSVADIKAIIDLLRNTVPNGNLKVVVFLAKLIPLSDSAANVRINALNAQMASIAAEKSTADSPVRVVDQNSGFNSAQDTLDGKHPTTAIPTTAQSGEKKIAQKWFEALQLAAAKPNVGRDASGPLTLAYRRVKVRTALSYEVQVSSDLTQWQSGAAHTQEVSVVDDEPATDTEIVTVRDLNPAGSPSRYMRLRLNYAQ